VAIKKDMYQKVITYVKITQKDHIPKKSLKSVRERERFSDHGPAGKCVDTERQCGYILYPHSLFGGTHGIRPMFLHVPASQLVTESVERHRAAASVNE
jgi:hypothetical protein